MICCLLSNSLLRVCFTQSFAFTQNANSIKFTSFTVLWNALSDLKWTVYAMLFSKCLSSILVFIIMLPNLLQHLKSFPPHCFGHRFMMTTTHSGLVAYIIKDIMCCCHLWFALCSWRSPSYFNVLSSWEFLANVLGPLVWQIFLYWD